MRKTALTLAALALAASAHAQTANTSANINQPHTYGLLSLGQSRLNVDCNGVQACDRSATGGKAVLGYAFGNGFSLEGGYHHLGKFRASNGPLSVSGKPEALSLSGAYTAALTPDWGLTGRVGVASVRTKLHADAGVLSGSDSERKTQPIVGLGLNYAITPAARIELGVDATRAQVQGERSNLRMVSLGGRFAF